eukprot:TRINITY_DN22667_c0_g4_i1.p1 TRINITY_DN22667_c0_g4~~TRINITY_DN22667_c0_g4_i1.p1  ORF type:complete len:110 (-),score=6.50 TRINITY_DN22667_c0_g4_i1:132-461(-)
MVHHIRISRHVLFLENIYFYTHTLAPQIYQISDLWNSTFISKSLQVYKVYIRQLKALAHGPHYTQATHQVVWSTVMFLSVDVKDGTHQMDTITKMPPVAMQRLSTSTIS